MANDKPSNVITLPGVELPSSLGTAQVLRAIALDLEEGRAQANEVIVCLLQRGEDELYDWSIRIAGMRYSQAITLLELAKLQIARLLL